MSNANLVYEDLVARGKAVRTAKEWRRIVGLFEGVCGVKGGYERGDVIKFLAWARGRGISQNSLNTMMRPLRLLSQLQKWPDGFPRLVMPKVRSDEVCRPVMSLDEVHGLIINARRVCSARDLAFLAVATTYGLRREEVGTLEVVDGFVKIHTVKGGSLAKQLIPPEIKPFVKAYKGTTDIRWLSRIFERITGQAGFEAGGRCGWHAIRRGLITELVLRDVSALNIVRFIRWSDSSRKSEFGMLALYAKRDQKVIDETVFAVHPFLPFWKEEGLTEASKMSYSIQNEGK